MLNTSFTNLYFFRYWPVTPVNFTYFIMDQLEWRMSQVCTIFLVFSVAVKDVVVDITS